MNLLDRTLEVYRTPGVRNETAYGWIYQSAEILRPPATVTPLGLPHVRMPIADLLP